MKRIEGVDALRGLLACGIMLFHYTSWNNNQFHAGYHEVLNVLAVLAVEMFFIISGFSLYFVYRERLGSFKSIKQFFVRRFFRIAPLYYALLILVILIKLAASYYGVEVNRPLDYYLLATNFTFIFGFVWPPNSLLVGGWSIGVEMVMYLFFPFLFHQSIHFCQPTKKW